MQCFCFMLELMLVSVTLCIHATASLPPRSPQAPCSKSRIQLFPCSKFLKQQHTPGSYSSHGCRNHRNPVFSILLIKPSPKISEILTILPKKLFSPGCLDRHGSDVDFLFNSLHLWGVPFTRIFQPLTLSLFPLSLSSFSYLNFLYLYFHFLNLDCQCLYLNL